MTNWIDLLHSLAVPAADASMVELATKVFVIVVAVLIVGALLSFIVGRLISRAEKTATDWDDALLKSLRLPLTLIIWVIGLTYATELAWSVATDKQLLTLAANLRTLGVTFCLVLFVWRFLSNGEDILLRRQAQGKQRVDRAGVRAINKILKAAAVITGILMALNTMGYSISGVLAFGGIGGLALGFAAKDLLANFFGGLMVYLDRPFVEGDWIRSPDREIEGTVEHIGWRQTKIRSFASYPIYVPNSVFTQITIENPSRMACRRIHETVGVRYGDLAKVGEIVTAIKAMLKSHPGIAANQTLIVNLNQFSDSSVDILIYTYTQTTQWIAFHEVKQDVMLKIADIIEQHGGEIAYPTRTLHWAGSPPQKVAD